MSKDAFQDCYGLTASEFETLIIWLSENNLRIRTEDYYKARGRYGQAGSRYEGEIMGIKLAFENVKDGEGGYQWCIRLMGETWKVEGLMSMRSPRNEWRDAPNAEILVPGYGGPSPRYIFRVQVSGDVEQYRHDMLFVRLFGPEFVEQ